MTQAAPKMTAFDVKAALSRIHTNDFFIAECKDGPTWWGEHSRMDAVAIKKSWAHPCVIAYEIKVSRQDFLRDNKWPGYLAYCNLFYFACPAGLIEPSDIDDPRVGLVWVKEGRALIKKQVPARAVEIPAAFYQYIIYSKIDSDRVPFVTNRQEFIEEYLKGKQNARGLASKLSSKLAEKVGELEKELADLKFYKEHDEGNFYAALREKMREVGSPWFDVQTIVDILKQKKKYAALENFIDAAKRVITFEDVED